MKRVVPKMLRETCRGCKKYKKLTWTSYSSVVQRILGATTASAMQFTLDLVKEGGMDIAIPGTDQLFWCDGCVSRILTASEGVGCCWNCLVDFKSNGFFNSVWAPADPIGTPASQRALQPVFMWCNRHHRSVGRFGCDMCQSASYDLLKSIGPKTPLARTCSSPVCSIATDKVVKRFRANLQCRFERLTDFHVGSEGWVALDIFCLRLFEFANTSSV